MHAYSILHVMDMMCPKRYYPSKEHSEMYYRLLQDYELFHQSTSNVWKPYCCASRSKETVRRVPRLDALSVQNAMNNNWSVGRSETIMYTVELLKFGKKRFTSFHTVNAILSGPIADRYYSHCVIQSNLYLVKPNSPWRAQLQFEVKSYVLWD